MRKQKPCMQAHPSFEKERVGNPRQGEEGGKFYLCDVKLSTRIFTLNVSSERKHRMTNLGHLIYFSPISYRQRLYNSIQPSISESTLRKYVQNYLAYILHFSVFRFFSLSFANQIKVGSLEIFFWFMGIM